MDERMIQWLRRLLLCAAMFIVQCSMFNVMAQDDIQLRQIYSQAESDLKTGRTEEARDTLLLYLDNFKGTLKRDALRIIAMSCISDYDEQKAEEYVKMMLAEDPYYSASINDPPIFVNMVNEMKAGMTAKVTTASSQAESLDEVPVPTTLITEEMIRNSGGRNLQEVLAAYVPGMNIVDCNQDINIGMRDIYGTSQDKILFLLNGHRLNSYFTNAAAPDFSISLEKIRQIEVLRGPASSIYGGVALTAVVNIITKQGADVDGFVAKAEAGNYGQLRGDLLFGKRYFDLDVLAWISGYRNAGEKRTVSEEHQSVTSFTNDTVNTISIGRVGDKPSYDIGLQLGYRGLQLLYNTSFSQVVPPYTFSTSAWAYNQGMYRTNNDIAPSFANCAHHLDLSYRHLWGPFGLRLSATYDKEDVTQYKVFSESANAELNSILQLENEAKEVFELYDGLTQYMNGQNQNFGLQLKSGYNYALGSEHKGRLMFGAEYSHFKLDDIRYQLGYSYELFIDEIPLSRISLVSGRENSANASLQLKHQWRSLILNAGLRFDHKHRYDDTDANVLSPRVALILLRPKWNAKLSYSKSFVDGSYLNRIYNTMYSFFYDMVDIGQVRDMSPEYLHSLQLSFAGHNWVKGLHFEVNGFYNHAHDLIKAVTFSKLNSGEHVSVGVELMANYRLPRFTADLNLTWVHTFKSLLYNEDFEGDQNVPPTVNDNNGTPAITSNLVLGWQVTPRLKLHTHILFEGRQCSYFQDLNQLCEWSRLYEFLINLDQDDPRFEKAYLRLFELQEQYSIEHSIDARAILNIGADYKIGRLTLGLNVRNLLNTRYNRGGMDAPLMPQQGCWWTASVSYHF